MSADGSCFVPRASSLSPRTSQRHPHSKGIDDALRPGAPAPAARGRPAGLRKQPRPPGQQLGACLPSMCSLHACMSRWAATTNYVCRPDDGSVASWSEEEKRIDDQARVFFFSVMAITTPLFTPAHIWIYDLSSEGFWVPTLIGTG